MTDPRPIRSIQYIYGENTKIPRFSFATPARNAKRRPAGRAGEGPKPGDAPRARKQSAPHTQHQRERYTSPRIAVDLPAGHRRLELRFIAVQVGTPLVDDDPMSVDVTWRLGGDLLEDECDRDARNGALVCPPHQRMHVRLRTVR